MSHRRIPSLALATALLGAAAPVAAQQAAATAPRPVASYHFAPSAGAALPAEVTVADSAGSLVASFRLAGGSAAQPMLVTVLDTDLVLQGETPGGVLTLRLLEANGDTDRRVAGRWWLGERLAGELRGRAPR